MKKIKALVAMFALAALVVTPFVFASDTLAIDPLTNVCSGNADSEICKNKDEGATSLIGNIVNTMLFIIGTLSVIMIIVAGILYTTSGGDSGKVARAKNTLTYAIVGLIIAFLAYAIVNWVFRLFDDSSATQTVTQLITSVLGAVQK